MDDKLMQVCRSFRIKGTYKGYEEITVGNVNHTYKVNFIGEDEKPHAYIVQALNTYVFQNPEQVMDNIDKVTRHIHAKRPEDIYLHFHHTDDKKTYLLDADGFWRLFNYIPSDTYNLCDNMDIIRSAGRAFGGFQTLLADFDASRLYATIPDFHNTRKRYAALKAAAAQDPMGRAAEVKAEIDWYDSMHDRACTLTDMYNRGELPLRVTHNDTKINNVLFEKNGTNALTVIDLDTVMPGLVGHDFGDAMRFAANYVEEDCPDADRAGVNMEVFSAFTDGFLSMTAGSLTPNEIDTLAISSFALTWECGSRFLADYIQGDPYFKICYPKHNLVRTRCQIALAKDMLRHMDEMNDIVQAAARKYM